MKLAELLRVRREEILSDFARRVSKLPDAHNLGAPAIIDDVPRLLDRIADAASDLPFEALVEPPQVASEQHAEDRQERGFSLSEVVAEYGILRDCVHRLWQAEASPPSDLGDLRPLHLAIDSAVSHAVQRYVSASARTLQAFDQISTAAIESRSIDELLARLLAALIETAGSIDTAAIFLREGDMLVMRAAVGHEADEVAGPLKLRMDEGFAGRVAREGRPLLLQSAATDPIVQSAALKKRGVCALYGIPLNDDGDVIGVTYVGSTTVRDFSERDKALLRAMAGRATAGLVQHLLREQAEERRVQAERSAEQLDLERRRMETTLRGLPAGVVIAEAPSGRIVFVNRICEVIFGRPCPLSESIAAYGEWHLLTPSGEEVPVLQLPLARALLHGEAVNGEMLKFRKQGSGLSTISINAAPIHDASGRIVAAVAAFDDVTQDELAAAERDKLLLREQKARAAAETAMRARAELLRIVSHDLKSPINAILLNATQIGNAVDARNFDRVRLGAARIERTAKRMGSLVANVLDAARVEENVFSVEKTEQNVRDLVEEAIDPFIAFAEAQEIAIVREVHDEGPLSCDRSGLLQVLSNLLDNAVRYTPPGGQILVRALMDAEVARFEVSDTGPGIKEASLGHLFDRYWTSEENHAGTGLGLYIAKGIVEGHGGTIGVISEPGHGTTFFFTIPRQAARF